MDHVPDGLAVEVWALQVGDLFVAPLEFSQIAGVVSVKEYRVLVGVVAVSESVGELASHCLARRRRGLAQKVLYFA